MKLKQHLFYLVKSLSENELNDVRDRLYRYKTDTNYILLLNEILNQEEYNEKAIKEKFKNKRFIKQLHVTKINLSTIILESVRQNGRDSNAATQIIDLLKDIEKLFSKELYEIALSKVKAAYFLSTKFEKNHFLPAIIEYERKIRTNNRKNDLKALKNLGETEQLVLENLIATNHYWKNMVFFPHKQSIQKTNDALIEIPTTQMQIFKANFDYLTHISNQNFPSAINDLNTTISLLEKNEHKIKDEPSQYITAVNNKISFLLSLKKYEECIGVLINLRSKLKQFNFSNGVIKARVLARTYTLELDIYSTMDKIENADELISEIKSFVNKYSVYLHDEYIILFHFQFAFYYFRSQKWSLALQCVNNVNNRSNHSFRIDIQTQNKLLTLMIHYEMGNFSTLKYLAINAKRFLKSKKTGRGVEFSFLNLLINLNYDSQQKKVKQFNSFYTKCTQNLKEQNYYNPNSVDILAWVKTKT